MPKSPESRTQDDPGGAPGGLGAFFAPRSIAVLGASTDPDKIGGVPVAMLKRAGFEGRILPVNPNQATVQGLPAYATIAAVPGEVDLAVVALPAKLARDAVDACLDKGARGIVMFTAGLGEVSEEGRVLQAEIAATCQARGARLLGPNSLGLFSPYGGVFPTFSASLQHTWPRRGRVALATQSGAVGSFIYAMLHERGLGISRFVATGNEADIDVADCVDWFADDPETGVVVAYVEGTRNGPGLRAALLKARRAGKPVIVLKVGNTVAGAAAAASHTGALAGEARAYEAVFAEAGAYQARSMAEVADMAEAAVAGPPPRGRRLAVITPSGGVGVMLADQAEAAGLAMDPLPPETQAAILALVPFANATNPIDTTAQVVNDMSLMSRIHDLMMAGGDYDVVISFLVHMGRNPGIMDQLVPPLAAMRRRYPATVFIVSTFTTPESKARLREAGFLVYDEPTQALNVAAGLGRLWARPAAAVPLDPEARLELPPGPIDEATATALLRDRGIPFPPSLIADGPIAAADAASRLGGPVALKVISPDIAHKSDVGGVALGLATPEATAAAYEAVMTRVRAAAPGARLSGALVTRMAGAGVETVLGAYRDPVFGPMVMFGLGGVLIEVFRDVVFRPAPVDRHGARAMIAAVKGHALLTLGARGRPPADLDALADAIARLSQVAAANADRLVSIEINPFIALPDGGVAVDALMVRDEPEGGGAA